jgi:glycosyltransferase involved in cell wall biosynthesis
MVPVEAQACGCPVVAVGIGGACETVLDGVTGSLADDGSVDAFAEALERCRQTRFDRDAIRANALRFSREHFRSGFQAAVTDALNAGSHR